MAEHRQVRLPVLEPQATRVVGGARRRRAVGRRGRGARLVAPQAQGQGAHEQLVAREQPRGHELDALAAAHDLDLRAQVGQRNGTQELDRHTDHAHGRSRLDALDQSPGERGGGAAVLGGRVPWTARRLVGTPQVVADRGEEGLLHGRGTLPARASATHGAARAAQRGPPPGGRTGAHPGRPGIVASAGSGHLSPQNCRNDQHQALRELPIPC